MRNINEDGRMENTSILDRINRPGMGGKDAQDFTAVFSTFRLDTVRKVLGFGGESGSVEIWGEKASAIGDEVSLMCSAACKCKNSLGEFISERNQRTKAYKYRGYKRPRWRRYVVSSRLAQTPPWNFVWCYVTGWDPKKNIADWYNVYHMIDKMTKQIPKRSFTSLAHLDRERPTDLIQPSIQTAQLGRSGGSAYPCDIAERRFKIT